MSLTYRSCGAMHPTVHPCRYQILEAAGLPEDLRDELSTKYCPANDCGVIVNPKYSEKLMAWLKKEQLPVECYILWWSW